ncbi:hypothetical protein Thini_0318 [Thiothrix nivea DSM 5205]|uniref:DUF4332 domain-containing protein n=1 Tax=Thiothrix nivea (strain ATCC 35100 / DSM 5205 / JP2) TaxID=870187 RepID=A0A656HC37_THINJ|nr:hypothetical protein Thini_0318 [Thiothrix nivea DSM 5205]
MPVFQQQDAVIFTNKELIIVNTANSSYTFGMATGEIITLLLFSFLVGALLCWILRGLGLCCRQRIPKPAPTHIPPVLEDVPRAKSIDFPVSGNNLNLRPISAETGARLHLPPDDVVDIGPTALAISLPDSIDPHKPIIDPPDMEMDIDMGAELEMSDLHTDIPDLNMDMDLKIPDIEADIPAFDPLLDGIDPHKPIVDLPDTNIDMGVHATATEPELPELDGIDPHKPIVDSPESDMAIEMAHDANTLQADVLPDNIDPHKPIIDPPDMPEGSSAGTNPTTIGHSVDDWLHKAKEKVSSLSDKATPAAHDWLHKAKERVEHLTDKAAPATSEWLNKAKEKVDHLSEKTTPMTHDWLHKAKEKGGSLGSETLMKGSSTLAALATSAKELSDKLAHNLNIHHDDLQKLKGIGPTFASILHRAGIHTYQQVAETSPQKLQALLIVEDEQFSQHDTSSWPQQAALAAQEEWDKLKEYQDTLPTA